MVLRIFYGPNCCGCYSDVCNVFGAYDVQTPGPEWWTVFSVLLKGTKMKDLLKCLLLFRKNVM